jgi:DNA-binding response OmpR family regulator
MSDATADPSAPILVVEDDPHLRLTVEWTLADDGLMVESVPDGRAALDWLEHRRPQLVLLDIGLPGVDGYGVAEGLRERYGTTVPIVVLTADGSAPEKARRVGAVDYMHKPFDIDAFLHCVRRALVS